MSKKVLIVGGEKTSLTERVIKEQYGESVKIYTVEEAMENGLTPNDFDNLPTYEITAPPPMIYDTMYGSEKSGKEKRRERRKKERMNRKFK